MTTNKQQAPTLGQVEKLETRLVDLQLEAEALGRREEALTKQIAECHASGSNKDSLDKLVRQRREVREQRADILEALPLLQDQIARDREAACKAEAEKRLSQGIPRACGSYVSSYAEVGKLLVEATRQYAERARQLSERFKQHSMARAEANALADRFGLPRPQLPSVVAPALHAAVKEALGILAEDGFVNHGHIATAMEHDEHHLRTRRSYAEIAATPGGEIIKAAGLGPWPDLTPRQREIVASRAREREEEEAMVARFGAEAARSTQRALLG